MYLTSWPCPFLVELPSLQSAIQIDWPCLVRMDVLLKEGFQLVVVIGQALLHFGAMETAPQAVLSTLSLYS